jgi:F420-non-reducing hydrogenase iron-sulfur subunit
VCRRLSERRCQEQAFYFPADICRDRGGTEIKEFEPKIVGFLCNWCSYAGADAAGSARKTYPPNVGVIRVMCSGRVDPQFVLKAFQYGADGVMILGCHPGDCHYKEGNYKALRRFHLLKKMLSQFGIDEKRLRLDCVSASEADKFVETINDMVKTVKALGPLRVLSSQAALAKETEGIQGGAEIG